MYSVSLDTSLIFPSVATASVTTYPTTLLTNTFAPSIVYERHIGAPVFPNSIPLVGIECQNRTKKKEELVDEKKIDDLIKKRVEEQLIEYQRHEEKQRQEEKKYFHNDCHCHCTKHGEEKEISLNEKIERIREDLNLSRRGEETVFSQSFHDDSKDKNGQQKLKMMVKHKLNNEVPNSNKVNGLSFINLEQGQIFGKKVQEKQKLNNIDQIINKVCNCKFKENEMSLDKKLELIREEEKIYNDKLEEELQKKVLEFQKFYEKPTNTRQKKNSQYSDNLRTHYEIKPNIMNKKIKDNQQNDKSRHKINIVDSTINVSKIKKLPEAEFKRPLHQRSHWIPTGSNDYSQTISKRGNFLKNLNNSEPFVSTEFYNNEKPGLTITTSRPAQEIFETTVDSKTKILKRFPIKHDYISKNITDNSVKTKSPNYTMNVTKKFFDHDFIYPRKYFYSPISRSKTFHI